ncbi:uncharacterized protein LOC118736130 [Rhagoletis pomonella]|uniref:uncharacterized protein LOC118736130 n=1 Tax=Rhagoletis pomonella TaxID=28610 RepID=UPI001782CE13|nr:uncharacterized protein LOC118736130 [Rhagoletis pomonella]
MPHIKSQSTKAMFRYVPITLYGKSRSMKTYALIDDGSACTLLERHVAEELGLDGPSEDLCLRWTGDITQNEPDSKVITVGISPTSDTSPRFYLPSVRTISSLDLPEHSLTQEILDSHSHLRHLTIEPYNAVRATILLGIDNAKLGVPLTVKESEGNPLIATKSRIGWSVYGRRTEPSINYNRVMHICSCEPAVRLDEIIKENYALEAVEVCLKPDSLRSKSDERALEIMESSTEYHPELKKWETGLLWKYDHINLPESWSMAIRRLDCLERRMSRDPNLREVLNVQLKVFEEKGYIRKLCKGGRSWFLPSFTVTNKNKGKIRVVWDAAATVNGVALNTYLLKGPDMLASLLGVLIRFREHSVAITGDIREMFHQIRVRSEDQRAQQFLWRSGERHREPDVYVMAVITFGAACSPTLANFIKNKNAGRFSNEFPKAVDAINRNTYVDDWLQSVDTEREMITVAGQVKHIHSEGGFVMRKWLSNSAKVLEAISGTKAQSNKCLKESTATFEKVLGMWWMPQTDELTFVERFNRAVFNENIHPSKRSILRVIMSIGLIGFYMIQAKIILQNIWRSGCVWDDPINEADCKAWWSWIRILPQITRIRIPRCYPLASRSPELQLHIFCDASTAAYATAAYLRAAVDGTVSFCLVASRSRVTPLKPVSIPRLELICAILGLRLSKFIRKEMTLPVFKEIYWTDSKNVLYWVRSDARKFNQLVALRDGEILESTYVDDWRWVRSANNVADDATKWKQFTKLDGDSRWFNGPQFLQLPES